MKTRYFLLHSSFLAFFAVLQCFAQTKIPGNWEGFLPAGQKSIKIIVHITQTGSEFKTLMDSPDQGAVNIPLEQTVIKGDSLIISDPKSRISITGIYIAGADSIDASFIQRGKSMPFKLGRSSVSGFVLNRPQTPKSPLPYTSEEVTFVNKNANNIKLAGTLTYPTDGKIRCTAVLISGSGPQNRNEKGFDHEPFLVLSDFLTRNGIAVLRYDDRGVEKSEGDYKSSTSFDFSTDAEAAVDYLKTRKDIKIGKIGLIGHSEGGMIAPMVAARRTDVAFVISMAGPGVPITQLMIKQMETLMKSEKQPDSVIQVNLKMNSEIYAVMNQKPPVKDQDAAIRDILNRYNYLSADSASRAAYIKRTASPWFAYFIRYNPSDAVRKMRCPFLGLNGRLDKQVDAEMNLESIRSLLKKGKCKDYTLQYLDGLNHMFQDVKTGDVSEYRMTEQTMSPKAMETMLNWLQKRF